MESIPKVSESFRYPLRIPLPAYLYDHRIMGQPVLPAAQSLCLLADAVQEQTGMSGNLSSNAQFERFLNLPEAADHLSVFAEICQERNGSIIASLLTKVRTKTSTFSRLKKHVQVCFLPLEHRPLPSSEIEQTASGPTFELDPKVLYEELIPLGPAFRNCISGPSLTPHGAFAKISAPTGYTSGGSLGSPFVFDAALHVANAWAQRYAGIVAFPIGYDRRHILSAAREGRDCLCRVSPVSTDGPTLTFDIQLTDRQGNLHEAIFGIKMRDLSAGRAKPPLWLLAQNTEVDATAREEKP
jgi:hypothetical protein